MYNSHVIERLISRMQKYILKIIDGNVKTSFWMEQICTLFNSASHIGIPEGARSIPVVRGSDEVLLNPMEALGEESPTRIECEFH